MSRVIGLWLATLLCLLVAAVGRAGEPRAEIVRVAGSTTVLPIVSTAAGTYRAAHPHVTITVSGGGSGVGIASLIQKTADIGMASRELTAAEAEALGPGVKVVTIARDAVAVVVSKAVYLAGVHELSLAQIAAIYRGEIDNWHDLGGPQARILVIDKEAARGTRHVFAEAVLGNAHARAPGASIIAGSNNEEQAIVARSDNAIGMLSNAWLNDAVRGVAVGEKGRAVLPTLEHVRDGRYPISRKLHVVLPREASPAARSFVDYILSAEGQEIVERTGYLPVR